MKSVYRFPAAPGAAAALCGRSFFLFCFLLLASRLSADNYYWVNGDGAWSEFATHWAKVPNPGGPVDFHANVPTAGDDVFFTNNGGVPYTLNVNAGSTVPKCRNMDWTGVPLGTVWGGGGGGIDIYGSTTLDANMSMTFSGGVHFNKQDGATSLIWSKTVPFSCNLYFEGTSGGWQLMDELYCNLEVYQTGGLLETNGQKVTIGSTFYGNYSGGTGQLHLGSSEVIIGGSGFFKYTPTGFNAGTSHIKMLNANTFLVGPSYLSTIIHFYDVSFFSDYDSGGFAWAFVDGTLTFHGRGRIHGYSSGIVPVLNNVVFLQNGHIYNAVSYNNLTLTAGKTYTIQDYSAPTGTDQTILPGGSITALGFGTCSQFITIKSWQYGTHFNLVNNSGATQTVHCAILEDCHATGSDPLEVLDGVDLGNNTGWIFNNPHGNMDFYWVGGAGDWNDPNHWSDIDGGAPGICIPNGATNVHFTALSGFSAGNVVNVTAAAYCQNMDWTGVTGMPSFQSQVGADLFIYHSLTLAPPASMGFQNVGNIHFRGIDLLNVVTLAGQILDQITIFEGSGLYKFGDTFTTKKYVMHVGGELRTMGFPVQVQEWYGNHNVFQSAPNTFGSPGTKLVLGDPILNISSTLTMSDAFYPGATDFINEYLTGQFVAMQSHIICAGSGTDFIRTIYTTAIPDYWNVSCPTGCSFNRGNVLNKLSFTDAAVIGPVGDFHEVDMNAYGTILGDHHYDILTLYGGRSYQIDGPQLGGGSTQTINTGGVLNVVNANCSGLAYIYTGKPDVVSKIAKTSGTLVLHDVILDNILPDLTTGAAYSATNSVGLQPQVIADWNLTNPAPRNLFWVGGTGNWQDSNHWSLASGGATGQCPPTPLDNVRFNAASSLGAGSMVSTTLRWNFCKNMDWTGVTGGAKLYQTPPPGTPNQMQVFGDLTFSAGMVNDYAGPFWMRAKGAATITSAGNKFLAQIYLYEPMGDWTLNDPMVVDYDFVHHYGKFRTNDFSVTLGRWWDNLYNEPSAEAFLGNSTIFLNGVYNTAIAYLLYAPSTFHAGTSSFIFQGAGRVDGSYNKPEMYNVTFKNYGEFYGCSH